MSQIQLNIIQIINNINYCSKKLDDQKKKLTNTMF